MLAVVATACSTTDPLAGIACDPLVFSSSHSGEWQIHVLSAGEMTQLTAEGANVNPTWSPDGTRILFTSTRDGDHDLYTMAADGSDVRALTDDDLFESSGDWSPDGTRIVFDRVVDDDSDLGDVDQTDFAQIFIGDLDDPLVATQLTFGEPNAKPRWSPGGTTIAFLSWRDGNSEIYVMTPHGTSQRNLSSHPGQDTLPTWSPDGDRIAFVSDRDGNQEIYVMDADGTHQTRLTHTPTADTNPSWSSDGRHVLFTSDREHPGIYVTPVDPGASPTRVTDGFVHDCSPT